MKITAIARTVKNNAKIVLSRSKARCLRELNLLGEKSAELQTTNLSWQENPEDSMRLAMLNDKLSAAWCAYNAKTILRRHSHN